MPIDDSTPRYDEPTFKNCNVSEELDVQFALQVNVFDLLSTSIGNLQSPKEVFSRPSAVNHLVQGKPDFVLQAGGIRLFPVEVKTKWVVDNGDMVTEYNRPGSPPSVIDSIRQIFGYMSKNERQYGVLSTYDKTWFLWRPKANPSTLLISPVVADNDAKPSLLRCFAYIMLLARGDPNCPRAVDSPPEPPQDSDDSPESKDDERKDTSYKPQKEPPSGSGKGRPGNRSGDADKKGDKSSTRYDLRRKRDALGNKDLNRGELRLEQFGWNSYTVTDDLGAGRCGNVFEGTFRGEKVVIKLCDLWQNPEFHDEMLNEARTYVELGKLQGHGIPKLKGVGYTAGGLFALMTEFGGWPIKVENLNDEERKMILGVLDSIHGEGFLHGDLRCENILIEHSHDDPRITFIDFGSSRKFSNHKESEREMAALQKIIGFRSMKKPRIV
jgi:tRNA A-37 threonylcarbamoyl transferase component Bud32